MDYELNKQQDELLAEAERLVRREKALDFLNSPRDFFRRLRGAYYDERLVLNLRWLAAQGEEEYEEEYRRE